MISPPESNTCVPVHSVSFCVHLCTPSCLCLHFRISACVLWRGGGVDSLPRGGSVWRRMAVQPGCSALFHHNCVVRFEDGHWFEYHRSLTGLRALIHIKHHIIITLCCPQRQHVGRSPPSYAFKDNFVHLLTCCLCCWACLLMSFLK